MRDDGQGNGMAMAGCGGHEQCYGLVTHFSDVATVSGSMGEAASMAMTSSIVFARF